ncbi:excalibur calcium-binding domain-containing protein [Corynebacterium sp. SCR221107]|uniref:excalibur calcium-binding domain-containing protein n=1 Tax=Corynebacterium sp. SCR221107 TaxID=3017361 RepID=UPI0022EC72E0|nr:excalibur calcium-binding domain-containing protein [Corynebacterium sp. SCR221107]WBT08952.1 excalibur calcium-binding domain-containing protein [Corynebacterium sp. SCR221107]
MEQSTDPALPEQSLQPETPPAVEENAVIPEAPAPAVEENTVVPDAPAPAMQNFVQVPAPVETPAPASGGGGCASIGHKVYEGDPEYRPGLDRDNDKVACEDYPG